MRLSRNAHYAIRTVLDLSLRHQVRSAEIARRQSIPSAYMAKVVQELSRAGIVRTHRGTRGGVQLAKPASAVTLREIIEAAEGPLAINLCVAWGDCPCVQPCPVRTTLAQLQTFIEHELQAVTVEALANRLPPNWEAASSSKPTRRRPLESRESAR